MTELPDPRPLLERAIDQAARVAAAVDPDQLSLPTPCREYDLRQLLGHVVFATARVEETGRRLPITPEENVDVSGVPDAGWAAAFEAPAAAAVAAWRAPDALEGEIALPFGTFPAAVVAWIYTMELVTHAWDVATAAGRPGLLEPDLFEAVLPFAHQMLPPEGRDAPELPFDPVVPVAEDAPAPDRLAGYLGRVPGPVERHATDRAPAAGTRP